MFGLWKENLSYYNTKNTYRKVTTRKHNFKAKAKLYSKKYNLDRRFGINNSSKFCYNKELVIVTKENENTNSILNTQAIVYNALIKHPIEYSDWGATKYKTKNVLIYEFKSADMHVIRSHSREYSNYFRYDNNTPLDRDFNSFEIIQLTETKFTKDLSAVEFNRKYFRKHSIEPRRFSSYNEKMFMFNKPITWEADLDKVFRPNNRRKYAKKMANKKDRMRCNQYISNQNWDSKIKTHSYSKSINWYID